MCFEAPQKLKHYSDLLPVLVTNTCFPLCDVVLQKIKKYK